MALVSWTVDLTCYSVFIEYIIAFICTLLPIAAITFSALFSIRQRRLKLLKCLQMN